MQVSKFGEVEMTHRGGVRGAEVAHDRGDVGEQQQPVRGQAKGQLGRGEVFVDDGLDAGEPASRVLDDGRPAAAAAHHDGAGIEFIPVTGFVVTPVLAWWTDPHPVAAVDPVEVARAEVVPIATLAEPANRFRVRHPSGLVGPGFDAAGLFVWGFTAGLLDVLLRLGGWAREWDTERERPLPPHLVGRPSR